MENDPEYKNKEEEVNLLSYLEKMPSENWQIIYFQKIKKIKALSIEIKTGV